VTNRYLEQYGHDARIDHRSHAERGIDEQPTIHEGVIARALEAKGIVSDRCEINRQIKADNALLRELKAAVKKLTQAVKNTIPVLAEAMENVRSNVMIFCYQLGHIRGGQKQIRNYLSSARFEMARYTGLAGQIKEKSRERKALLTEQKDLSFWNVPKKKELTARIAELTELLEELRSEKAVALQHLRCVDDSGIPTIKKDIATT
jgi:chromosome segregation ATPase